MRVILVNMSFLIIASLALQNCKSNRTAGQTVGEEPADEPIQLFLLESETRPTDNGVEGTSYPGKLFIVDTKKENGLRKLYGPFRASSHPNSNSNQDNSTTHAALEEASYFFNNESGHLMEEKGLNIVNKNNERIANGLKEGNLVHMKDVNIHKGNDDLGNFDSRGSLGGITIHPDDADAFFARFDFSGGFTGNSYGVLIIYRQLDFRQHLLGTNFEDFRK